MCRAYTHSPHFGWGEAANLGKLLGNWFQARRLLIVADSGLHKAGVLEPAKASLLASGFAFTMFDAVVADPPEQVLLDCVAQGRDAKAEIVLGNGGGSSMDVAKIAAVMLVSEQPLSDLYGIGKVHGSRLPLVQVPTTAGTGSEVTNITILTRPDHSKMGVVADQLYADRVLLDAELTMGLPALHTAATGIDAMVHAIEAYTSRHKKNPLSDAAAREALRLLSANLVAACEDGSNRAAHVPAPVGASSASKIDHSP
ncbi:MAG: iron-containing alcohol dehydrogenase [Pseudorhizobium sp.]